MIIITCFGITYVFLVNISDIYFVFNALRAYFKKTLFIII
jgi:hypothetical protein